MIGFAAVILIEWSWWWQEHAPSIESCGRCSPRCEAGPHARGLRPRFMFVPGRPPPAQGSLRDTHVTTTVHSYDDVHDPTALSVNAASCALALSSAPWHGPAGCVRVAIIGGEGAPAHATACARSYVCPRGCGNRDELVLSPDEDQLELSTLNLLYAANERRTLMIEASASELSEVRLVDALHFAHSAVAEIIATQRKLARCIGRDKRAPPTDTAAELARWAAYRAAAETAGLQVRHRFAPARALARFVPVFPL